MVNKEFEIMTDDDRRLHEKFVKCKTLADARKLEKEWNKLNEGKNNEIPYYDITLEELTQKYGLISHEDVWKNIL